jgi:hypothetical protein
MLDYNNIKKLKIGILIATSILTIGSISYEFYNINKSYNKIQQNQIQTFESLWKTIWDSNKNIFNDKLDNITIQKLEELVSTPNEKNKLNLAKLSLPFVQINYNESNLSQILNASNNYYQNEEKDDEYKEQETFNKNILQQIEDLINQLNQNNKNIEIKNEKFTFDQTSIEQFQLTPIKTTLKCSELNTLNKNINDINFLIKRQIEENQIKLKEQEIIDLKTKLDNFVKKTKEYQDKIKSDYISIKNFKDLLNEIYNIKIDKNLNYFNKIKDLDFKNKEENYTITFTDEFFEKNTFAKKYKNYLKDISIQVNLSIKLDHVNKKENESKLQTIEWIDKLDISKNDDDLININTLNNIKLAMNQKQEMKKFVETNLNNARTSETSQSTNQSNYRIGRN